MKSIARMSVGILLLATGSIGCVQGGARPSIWPTITKNDTSGAPASSSVSGKLAQTAQGVKGQFSSMGTAVSSAYGKAKSSISSAFTTSSSATGDPTSVNAKPPTIGPEIYVAQGHLYESTGQYPKALDNFSKALEIEPKNMSALSSIARLHVRQNENDKAAEFFKRALDVNPGDASLYVEYGDCQKKLGQLANAKESYMKAINLQPKEASHRMALAGVLLDEGRDQEALTELTQVEAPAMANYRMAYLYFARQKTPEAQQHVQTALSIDPNMQPARDLLNQMGGIQTAQQAYGIYQNAGNVVQNVRSLVPTSLTPAGVGAPASFSPAPSPGNGGVPTGLTPPMSANGPAANTFR